MKKLFITLSAVLALAACSESNIAEIENPQQEENASSPVTFNITVQEQGATKALKTDWADGDVIYIRFNGINDKYIYITYNGSTWDVTESTAFSASDFEGKTLTLGAVHFPIDVEASFSGNNLQFKKDGQDIASYCMYQSNAAYTVDGINVTIKLSLQKPDNVVLFHVPGIQANASDYSLKVSAEETNVRAFLCRYIGNDGIVSVSAKTSKYPIIGVADADGGLFCATYMEGNGLGSSKDYTFTLTHSSGAQYVISGSKTIAAGKQYGLPALNSGKWKATLPFSVAADKKVFFSPGNLQYQASTSTWRFAEHQYTIIGNAAGNSTTSGRSTQSYWVDLFGWGTSGYSFGSGYGTNYQPWQMDTPEHASYFGPTGTVNLTGTYANGDWGVANAIDSYPAGKWRTFTKDELKYLIENRSASTIGSTTNARFQKATVVGVKGLILFPDEYTHPSGSPVSYINNGSVNYLATYDETAWAKTEAAGAIFLPAAGLNDNNTVTGVNNGYYWTSTAHDAQAAFGLIFYNDMVLTESWADQNRSSGYSVRLVRDAE